MWVYQKEIERDIQRSFGILRKEVNGIADEVEEGQNDRISLVLRNFDFFEE